MTELLMFPTPYYMFSYHEDPEPHVKATRHEGWPPDPGGKAAFVLRGNLTELQIAKIKLAFLHCDAEAIARLSTSASFQGYMP